MVTKLGLLPAILIVGVLGWILDVNQLVLAGLGLVIAALLMLIDRIVERRRERREPRSQSAD